MVDARARSDARQRFRDRVLDVARDHAVRDGWGSVRMGRVADEVGVTRQTLHNEFGTKDAFGQAMVLREADRFLVEVGAALDGHPDDLTAAVAGAATTALDLMSQDPLLRAAIAGDDVRLLPLLTTRGEPVLTFVTAFMLERVADRLPAGVDATDVVADLVRLVISHAVTPTQPPGVVGERVGALFAAAVLAQGPG